MARLVDPLASERPIPRQPGGIAKLNLPGPGDVGRGLIAAGRFISAGAEDIYRAQKIEEERVDTLRAEDAFTQLRERQLDLSVGDENGFSNLKGADAVTKPVFKEWSRRFEDAEAEITGTLNNDQQRTKFKQRADVVRLQFQEEILRHLGREGDVYSKEVYDGTVGVEQRNAVARWDSPNDVALSLDRIKAAVDERAERFGWAADYQKAVVQLEHGKVHSAVVQQALASGNYRYAQAWYEQHKADIDLPTAKALERAVEDGTQKELSAGYTAQYLANEDNPGALASLRKTVLADGALGDDRRNMLVGRIQNREYVLERRAEVEEDRRVRRIERGIGELNASTLAGFEPSQEQFTALIAAAKGTDLESEVRHAMNLADSTRSFRSLPPVEQERALAAVESGIRMEPTKFDRRVVSAWRSIYESQRKQAMDAPVSFAVQQGIIAPPTPLDLSQPDAMGPALRERYDIARGMASRYQTGFKPLTPEEVKLLTTVLADATVEQKRNYFAGLARASGNDSMGVQGYLAVMAQLAPDDPVTAIAGSQAARGRNTEADLILRGQAILRPPAKSEGKPDGTGLLPLPPETDLRMAFDSYIREAFSGKPEARNAHYQAAKAAYAALSVDAGDRDTKVLQQDRWEQAMTVAIGRVEKYRGRRVILPHGVDADQFRDGVRQRIDDAVWTQNMDPSWTAERLRDLPLESIGDGRYVLRSGDAVVVGLPPHSRPIIRNPDGSISTERTITIEADGRHLILPTIVDGKQVSENDAVRLWREGKNQAVGNFSTAEEANRAARERTEALSRALQPVPVIIDFNRPATSASAAGRVRQIPGAPAPVSPSPMPATAPALRQQPVVPPAPPAAPALQGTSAAEEERAWESRYSKEYLEREKRVRALQEKQNREAAEAKKKEDAARKKKRPAP